MTVHIAFLRAINVGGHVVKMDRLRGLFEALGFADVETYIASGNVVFASRSTSTAVLERRIESHLCDALGYEVAAFLRSPTELTAIAGHEPFSAAQVTAAKTLNIGFLSAPLDAAARKKLLAMRTDIDDFHVHEREVFWLCRKRQSESTFSNVKFEKAVGVRATFRGVNTVRAMVERYAKP